MNLDTIAETVFEVCSDKSKGTTECVEAIVSSLGLEATFFGIEDAVRDYRLSGKSLSETAAMISRAMGGTPEPKVKMVMTRVVCNNGMVTDRPTITFESALQHFTDAGFNDPRNAAIFVSKYLVKHLESEGEDLDLDKVTELYGTGNDYQYDGVCFSCYTAEEMIQRTTDQVAECIAENAYDMAVDEVANMSLEDCAERMVGYCMTECIVVDTPSVCPTHRNPTEEYIIIKE